jgi:hypothetical protein
MLRNYARYCHDIKTHRSVDKDARPMQGKENQPMSSSNLPDP